MYSIGEFSKITGLTIKAIHLYHEMSLLVPNAVDTSNGYRFFDQNNVEKARAIVLLKNMMFSLTEIAEILKDYDDESEIVTFLERKRGVIETQLKQLKSVSVSLEKIIQQEREAIGMLNSSEFKIEEKKLAPMLIASIRWKGKYSDAGKWFGKLCRSAGRFATGKPFSLYHDMEQLDDGASIESCVPIKKKFATDGIICNELPGGKCVSLVHKGPYTQLSRTYTLIFDYIKKKHYQAVLPIREIYMKGPGIIFSGNPKNYLTEIQIVITEQGAN